MSQNKYVLIAQNNSDYSIEGIDLGSSLLQNIDLFTMQFVSEKCMAEYLFHKNMISSKDVGFFISFQDRKHDLQFYEVIYNRDNNHNVLDLGKVASMSLKDKKASNEVYAIINHFNDMIEHDEIFYKIVIANLTSIYSKFIDYYHQPHVDLSTVDGGWALHSYPLLRNIVEAECRYSKVKQISSDPLADLTSLYSAKSSQRMSMKKRLFDQTNKDVSSSQLNLFDGFEEKDKKVKVYPLPKIKISKRVMVPTYPISRKDKVKYVNHVINSLPNHPFVDGNVNTKYFSCPIDDIDYACLSNYLNAETKKILGSYTYKKNTYYHDAEKYGYFHNQLYTEALQDLKKIERRICGKDAFYLDRLFAFCNLYHRYQNNSKMIANVKEGALDNGEKGQGSAK